MGARPQAIFSRRNRERGKMGGLCWHCGRPLVNGSRSVREIDGNPVQLHINCAARFDSEQAEECLTARERTPGRYYE